ncbi:adenosylcobinamide-GDP ribazoletransferase [Parafrankia colletiae]|uniref:Adenosylcobinamide-GDP ribazoletransferase n=1 Tax=Parafrankia colletiae TaxID=573497 RepID=A0A1S1QNI2_9ACTN|nr:adenosylcobinamide-GDP ribazoletransferase [Parafrankia colletiae]MCK9904637.1 adenosylcobinamide-GDP ribazoletransferase [Frankia sp. Cpl3]OHV35126.1 adenosylcobinamide-GDP ribazoletransferase [Parafrankia colletiae]
MIGARAAVTLLTVVPIRGPERLDRTVAGRAMVAAPAVGFALGFVCALAVVAMRIMTKPPTGGAQTLLPAVVGVALLAGLTRGLHLDGLADVADAVGVRGGRERVLAVMRESTIGAFGAVTVLFVVLVQVSALSTAIAAHRGTVSVLVAAMTSRLAATWSCVEGVPAARPDGLGALVAGTVRRRDAVLATAGVFAVAALAGRFDFHGGDNGRAVRAVVAAAVALGAAFLLRRRLVRRFGGVTGDTLGATIEITTMVSLVTMAMTIPTPALRLVGLD